MPARKGTYTLLLHLATELERSVGALGRRTFRPGWYAYTGSAFGPGGFARIDRHRRIARGRTDTRHWHIDYLLPGTELRAVYRAVDEAIECQVARQLPGDRVDGVGASDCDCPSHLTYSDAEGPLREALERLYGSANTAPA